MEVLDTPTDVTSMVPEPSLKKTERKGLRADKWLSMKHIMETGLETKYMEISVSETDLSVLSNTYELVQQNKAFMDHLVKWDMQDVFTLVKGVNDTTKEADTVDPLAKWPNLELDVVAQSNQWYHSNFNDTIAPWIKQNLEMSHRFIINSCEQDLQAQLTDSIERFPTCQQGGPLTFKILMDKVSVNSERAIKHLIASVKKMDVKDFDGENITKVSAQINGAYKKLKMVSFNTANSSVPLTFPEDVMDVLQTTSTPKFNDAFDYTSHRARNILWNPTPVATPAVEDILLKATDLYTQMLNDNTWLGSNHKAKETALVNQGGNGTNNQRRCFNCGATDHSNKDCTKPDNPDMQKEMKRQFKQSKQQWNTNRCTNNNNSGRGRGGGSNGGRGTSNNNQNNNQQGRGGRGGQGGRDRGRGSGGQGRGGRGGNGGRGASNTSRFCPPAPYENNRRTIQLGQDLVPHRWNSTTNRWDREQQANLATQQQNQGGAGASQQQQQQQPQTGTNAATTRANLANLQQHVNSTFATMLSSINE